jgi:hypothetical protein
MLFVGRLETCSVSEKLDKYDVSHVGDATAS